MLLGVRADLPQAPIGILLLFLHPKMTQFSTKTIQWQDDLYHDHHVNKILVQNSNGPCFLIALVNSLILSSELTLNGWTNVGSKAIETSHVKAEHLVPLKELLTKNVVQLDELLNEITNLVIQVADSDFDLSPLLESLPKLHTGLNVNPNFLLPRITSKQDGNSKVLDILDLFNLELYHGWLIDELTPGYELLSRLANYDSLQSYILEIKSAIRESGLVANYEYEDLSPEQLDQLLSQSDDTRLMQFLNEYQDIQNFLRSNGTELSETGLSRLMFDSQNTIKRSSFAIFFRNEHFNTVYKNQTDSLFTLLIDEGYSKSQTYVWQTLSSVDGSNDKLLDGNFEFTIEQVQPLSHEPIPIDSTDFIINEEELETANEDEALAKKLQKQEDENAARAIQKKYDTQAKSKSKSKSKSTNKSQPGTSADSNKRDKSAAAGVKNNTEDKGKCIVM
ncbi:BA75_05234T0 [Komagataella pastoris]|uniref:BA75_05234T0 n=1 Tax=Komagataella pastoris TaxID=4922 RepID=A0A1B2JJA5_PICPA|nr:BA75_05234T0 [Komagataella pastoris]